jgi:uncharacterized protein YdiU (UPF0061 family)
MTIFFRLLSQVKKSDDPKSALIKLRDSFYQIETLENTYAEKWEAWLASYIVRIKNESFTDKQRMESMNSVNPKYVLRNYMAQLAIDAADRGDYTIIDELHELLKLPYADQNHHQKWFAKRPEWARHKVGCSMLSCSS